jgi:hypothetical protein
MEIGQSCARLKVNSHYPDSEKLDDDLIATLAEEGRKDSFSPRKLRVAGLQILVLASFLGGWATGTADDSVLVGVGVIACIVFASALALIYEVRHERLLDAIETLLGREAAGSRQPDRRGG